MEYRDSEFDEFIKLAIKDDKNRHHNHETCCDHADEMAIHIYGTTPTALLDITRPNEDPAIKAYRLSVYQPKTKSTANKALSIVSKIFNQSLFDIKWKDQSSNGKKLEDYCIENYPVFNSVLVWLQETALSKMISDPNGVMVVKPKNFDIPDTDRAEPLVLIYGSKNIWHIDYESCLVLISKERDSKRKVDIYKFEFYDNINIIQFTLEKASNGEITITEETTYPHGCKTMPVWQLRGTPEAQDNGTIIYKSFFEPAIAYWNDAIGHESDLKGAFINHMHPLRYEYDEECKHVYQGQQCKHGSMWMPNGESLTCPGCGGSGYKGAANSPYRIIRINMDKVPGQNDTGNFPIPAGVINIPTEPTELLDRYVDKQHLKGLEALNMDVVNKIGENQSGIAKVIDRGELYDFLSRIATVVFDVHLTNIFYYFNRFMFGVSDGQSAEGNLPTIVKPVRFDISSTTELVEQLATAKKAGLNPNYLKAAQNEIIEKKFIDPSTRQYLQQILENDPIPDYEPDIINVLQMNGNYKQTDVVIHFNISQFIIRAYAEMGDKFLQLDKMKKKELLVKYADELIADTKTQIKVEEPIKVDES